MGLAIETGNENIRRQKIVERDDFTYDEKLSIAIKSDERCCHCGKKVYFGYGATVDHFIPLSKGGTNRTINAIMLCTRCNQEKGDNIANPRTYLPYLKEPYRTQLEGYFESFIHSFEYVDRKNLLACDIYDINVDMLSVFRQTKKNTPQAKSLSNHHEMKRAKREDMGRLAEYYIEYLKKNDAMHDEDAARLNIEFWLKFGCIYYVEKNNDIKIMACAMITDASERPELNCFLLGGKYFLTLSVFSQYATPYACTLVNGIMDQIAGSIMDEQRLTCIPVRTSIVCGDRLTSIMTQGAQVWSEPGSFTAHSYKVYGTRDRNAYTSADIEKEKVLLEKFFGKFNHAEEEFDMWLEGLSAESAEAVRWMRTELKLESCLKGCESN